MSIARYLPGEDWLIAVRPGVVVLVPATTAHEVIDRLWDQLGENPNLHAILPIVAGGLGQDLASMPPFGVVSHTDRLHVLLRGGVYLSVTDDGGTTADLSGEHVTTWTERIFDGGADGFTLSTGTAGVSPSVPTFPLETGIVRASAVRVGSFGSADDDPERAITGALEAEEFATINPSLYLTSGDGIDEDGQQAGQGADSIGEDQNQQSEPDPELQTTGYDHLWDQTVVRRVEDAAVRPPEEDDSPDPAAAGEAAAAGQQSGTAQPTPTKPAAAANAAVPPSSPSTVSPSPEPAPIPPSAPGELIDSVPWARKDPGAGQPQSAPVTVAPPVANAGGSQSHPDSDDHDGQTVMRSDLQRPAPQGAQPPAEPRPGTGPLVLARLCTQGHANPPEASDCGVCSQPLDGEPQEVRRPSLGTMRISTGEVVELDQSLIIGRQPSVSRVQGRGMPKLVQVTSAGGDISRSHVEVRLDGWHVLLCDLKATNGTVLIRSGQPPRRLGEGETAFLLDGDVAQLGDDVYLRFEGLR